MLPINNLLALPLLSPGTCQKSEKKTWESSAQLQTELSPQSLQSHFLHLLLKLRTHTRFALKLGMPEYDLIDFHNMFLLCNADVHFSNILSKSLIWFVPPEHPVEAENHFYIWICSADWKPALAWERLETSHLKAFCSLPQPKHFTQGVKGHQLSKQYPNYTAGEVKQNGNSLAELNTLWSRQ